MPKPRGKKSARGKKTGAKLIAITDARSGQVVKSARARYKEPTGLTSVEETSGTPRTTKGKELTGLHMPSAVAESKVVRCEIRMTQKQQTEIEQAASILGFKNSTDYIRYVMHEKSAKVIREQLILDIAEKDRERFLQELSSASLPGHALASAAEKFKARMDK